MFICIFNKIVHLVLCMKNPLQLVKGTPAAGIGTTIVVRPFTMFRPTATVGRLQPTALPTRVI